MSAAAPVPAPVSRDEIVRYGFSERMCHWTSAAAYVYCMGTGLAFYTPHLFWIALALGGGATSRFWHPVLGVVFTMAAVWMHALWHSEMALSDVDREWLGKVKAYAANRDEEMPPQGRFNAGQKVYYRAMYYATILLAASGLFMWFPEYVPAGLRGIRGIAIVIHECAALVAIGLFIIHLYMSLFLEPGSAASMLFGPVTRAWAWTHHRAWYREVTGGPSRKR